MPRLAWFPVVLLACSAGADPEEPGASAASVPSAPTAPSASSPVDEPAPYVVDETTAPVLTVDLGEAEAVLQQALDSALQLNALPVQASYDAAMAHQSAACPYYYTTPDGTYWFDTCETEGGADYNGYVFAQGESGLVDPYSGATYDYWSAFGAATVVDPTGQLFEMGGQAYHTTAWSPGVTQWTSVVQGTFGWQGAEAVGSWLEEGLDPDFVILAYLAEVGPTEGRLAYLDGGYGGIGDGWAVAFDANQVSTVVLGSTCPEELSGTVGIRSPDGQWVDVVFDGPVDGEVVPPEVCDGCGAAFVLGEPVGTVCVDPSALVAWEASPW